MEWEFVDAYEEPETVKELLAEYTVMLEEGNPEIWECLRLQHYDDELEDLQGKYGRPEGRLYLIRRGEETAGCVALLKMDETRCEIKRLYVRPAYRGQGLGARAVEKILEEARAVGYESMYLDTLDFLKSAVELYRKLGFEEIPPYNDNPLKGTVFMKKVL